MTLEADNPRESVFAELEALAQEEASCGDARALRTIRRLVAMLRERAGRSRPMHQDDGN